VGSQTFAHGHTELEMTLKSRKEVSPVLDTNASQGRSSGKERQRRKMSY
jgi:hypothetical protein